MTDPEDVERRIDFIIREMDEFCSLTHEPPTRDLIENERIGIGQILTRAQLILSFIGKYPKHAKASVEGNYRLHGTSQH